MRQRFCNNPVPMGQGAQCSEPLIEEQMCNKQGCTPTGYAHGTSFGGTCGDQRGLFDCKNGIQCIDINLKCDCVPHCTDFSDEDVAYAGCVMDLIDCLNGAGIKDLMFSLGVAALTASLTVFRVVYG
ncbi:thrombospondin-1-like [Aplysia californica]|uniref:Thrombospondin-1-like n=1 Tax=Aplysia californica TaxID=6500 RepID=A0ABM1VP55_APLCA|nr:thrombospondin-1-like [Aplysia californica]